MTSAPGHRRLLGRPVFLLCGLFVAAALALPASPADALVVCSAPASGNGPTLKISPAALPPPAMAKYGFKLKATVDGCTADATQLADWIPSKNGTPDGARIAKAEISLSAAGYGNCTFGLGLGGPTPAGTYDVVGTLKIKWLDANGDTIKSVKPSVAFIRMKPMVAGNFGGVSLGSIGRGTVTKGLGIGAEVRLTWPLDGPDDFDPQNPWLACMANALPIPVPVELDPAPLKKITLAGQPSLSVVFGDLE